MEILLYAVIFIILIMVFLPLSRSFERKYKQSINFFESEYYQEAYEVLDRLSRHKYIWLSDRKIQILNYQAFCLLQLGRYQESIGIYDRLIKNYPTKFLSNQDKEWLNQVHYFRGSALLELKQYQLAIDNFDKAVKYQIDDAESWRKRGYALDKIQQHEAAIASYDRAIECEPKNQYIWLLKTYSLYELGAYQKVIENCDRALQLLETEYYPYLWEMRGTALFHLRKYRDAIVSYDRALKGSTADYSCRIWSYRGAALYELEEYEDAIASYDKALENRSDRAVAYYDKACCYARQENVELVIENLRQAISIEPEECRNLLRLDKDFANLKQDKRFQDFLQSL